MDSIYDDPNERPTLPAPAMRAFDTQAEAFFCFGDVDARAPATEAEELAAWWVDQRRRTFVGWVAAAMAVCAGVLAAGLLAAPV